MKEYFLLQYRMFNRKLSDLGINSILAYFFGLLLVVFGSQLLFQKTGFANYIICLSGLTLLTKLANSNRNEFLQTVFETKTYKKIRVTENLLVALPFLIPLTLNNEFFALAALLLGSILVAGLPFKTTFNYAIPTPFYKWPFEFLVGFRNTYYIFPVVYTLTFIAISVGNLNLGIASMVLVLLVAASYYTKPENEYFVWSYASSPSAFLIAKIGIGMVYAMVMVLPVLILLCLFFSNAIQTIALFQLLGLVFLCTIQLAKYAAYPNEINMPQGILIGLCMYFPPLLLLLIPYFFTKATKNLSPLLK